MIPLPPIPKAPPAPCPPPPVFTRPFDVAAEPPLLPPPQFPLHAPRP